MVIGTVPLAGVSYDNDTVLYVGVPLYDSKHAVSIAPRAAVLYARPTWNNSVCHGVVSQVIHN